MEVLDSIEGEDILSVVIVNSSNTELAAFLREIGATQWMQQGYSDYSVKAEGKCPYCGRKLNDNFDQIVTESFDNRYQNNLRRLSLSWMITGKKRMIFLWR